VSEDSSVLDCLGDLLTSNVMAGTVRAPHVSQSNRGAWASAGSALRLIRLQPHVEGLEERPVVEVAELPAEDGARDWRVPPVGEVG